ncbi:MAG: carboxylating nicotinate-nucleotide diphosphorylase [Elusimicrobiota bacterium]
MLKEELRKKIKKALEEDIRCGDITTNIFISREKKFKAYMMAKSPCRVCGTKIAAEAFRLLNPLARIKIIKKDGCDVKKGEKIMEIESDRTILSAERTALNIIQRLSAIATASRIAALKARGKTIILDTRKTTPLWREEEKYAVKIGGCKNHRFGLYDAFMVKDNHLAAIGSFETLREKVALARKKHPLKPLEIEAASISQAELYASLKPDILMLDNMKPSEIKKAMKLVKKISPGTKIELSGGINDSNFSYYADCRPDFISIGALTHSIKAADISLEIETGR